MKSSESARAAHINDMAAVITASMVAGVMTAVVLDYAAMRTAGTPVDAAQLLPMLQQHKQAVLTQASAILRRVQREGLKALQAERSKPANVEHLLSTKRAAIACGRGVSTVQHIVAAHREPAKQYAAAVIPSRGRRRHDGTAAVSYLWTQAGMLAFLTAVTGQAVEDKP